MGIDEAIERLTEIAEISLLRFNNGDKKAIQLGTEALKLIQRERLLGVNPVETMLPGETKD